MTLPHNIAMFKRPAGGIKNRAVFDDPKMLLKSIFTKLANNFNNDNYDLALPLNAMNVKGFESLDPNDMARIRIHRDCKYTIVITIVLYIFLIHFIFYLSQIHGRKMYMIIR